MELLRWTTETTERIEAVDATRPNWPDSTELIESTKPSDPIVLTEPTKSTGSSTHSVTPGQASTIVREIPCSAARVRLIQHPEHHPVYMIMSSLSFVGLVYLFLVVSTVPIYLH